MRLHIAAADTPLHWVALAAAAKVVKPDGKPGVELPDGRRLGISRG